MPKVQKRILDPRRIRRVPRSGFSWIDQRLLREGILADLSRNEALLYFFLCLAADKDGLSYYGDRRIGETLRIDALNLETVRASLERRGLILYRYPLYQVLALPDDSGERDMGTARPSRKPSSQGATSLSSGIAAFLERR